MIRRSILTLVAAGALAVPAAASADPSVTRVSLAPQATFISTQQINVELTLSCPEGLSYSAFARVLQQQGAVSAGVRQRLGQRPVHRPAPEGRGARVRVLVPGLAARPGDRRRLRVLVHVRHDVARNPNHALRAHPTGGACAARPLRIPSSCGSGRTARVGGPGRIAQRESARFTRERSLVQSQVRPSCTAWLSGNGMVERVRCAADAAFARAVPTPVPTSEIADSATAHRLAG
jgi:hypothetical protein